MQVRTSQCKVNKFSWGLSLCLGPALVHCNEIRQMLANHAFRLILRRVNDAVTLAALLALFAELCERHRDIFASQMEV